MSFHVHYHKSVFSDLFYDENQHEIHPDLIDMFLPHCMLNSRKFMQRGPVFGKSAYRLHTISKEPHSHKFITIELQKTSALKF